MSALHDNKTRPWPPGTRVYGAGSSLHRAALARADIPGLGALSVEGHPDEVFDDLWDAYQAAIDPAHEHTWRRQGRYDGWGTCSGCALENAEAFPVLRTIDYGRFVVAGYWPEEWHLQGGGRGVVLRRGGGSYRTAFFEAFGDDIGFVRGEGPTLRAAEKAAWAKVVRILACKRHEYQTRGYRNGAGMCRHCDRFNGSAFDVKVVGHPCKVCGVGTNWQRIGMDTFCDQHAQPRPAVRKAIADGTHEPGPLEELLLGLDCDDEIAP